MKKILLILILFIGNHSFSQQSFSSNFINDVKNTYHVDSIFKKFRERIDVANTMDDPKIDVDSVVRGIKKEKDIFQKRYRKNIKLNLPVFGIAGIGNLNQESLSALNASGKISLFARPVQFRNNAITIYASYNKNASNNDSVIYEN